MSEQAFDRAAMTRLAAALNFIKGAGDPTVLALKAAAASGTAADTKKARALFLKLKASDRAAALAMLDSDD